MGSVVPQRTWQEKEPVSKAATSMHPKWVISITVSSKSVFRCVSAIGRHSAINFFFFSKVCDWKWPQLIDHYSGKDVCGDVIIETERRGNHTTPRSAGTGGQREEPARGVGTQRLMCRRERHKGSRHTWRAPSFHQGFWKINPNLGVLTYKRAVPRESSRLDLRKIYWVTVTEFVWADRY